MVVSMLAMLGLSMLSAGLDGARVVTHQSDEYRLTSAVENVGSLAAEKLWSGYLRAHGGSAGDIATFRAYMDGIGIPDAGPGGTPAPGDGTSLLALADLPSGAHGREFNDVSVDALQIVRRDDGDSSRLYVTVSARTNRGAGLGAHTLNRAMQLVYTIEPDTFSGFDYGILTKNVNCVFCHAVVDSTDRYYNTDPNLFGSFKKVKVGSLESMMLRHEPRPAIGDWDADSHIAGSVYVRGTVTNQNGADITDWVNLAFKSKLFDSVGNLAQDQWGDMTTTNFDPASQPYGPGENLYLDYPRDYSQMPDGQLPISFPPPFPDDGGIDPNGHPTSAGAGNKLVDPTEFHAVAQDAQGSISSGIINVTDGGVVIGTQQDFDQALANGNQSSLASSTTGNVILTGTQQNPIVIDGMVAIDGDVLVNGWVKGTGTIVASGNIYVPTDLRYLDGQGTFGVAADGTQNALGLAAGGNVLLGDYLKPSSTTSPGPNDIVTGDSSGPWNFSLAELSLFNRTEWAHTQQFLPGPGDDKSNPSSWTVPNPGYIADYVPRYYQFGPGDEIPIYNLGNIFFDASTGTWIGDAEVPLSWDTSMLTLLDPNDTSNPYLFDATTGQPLAAVLQLTPDQGWISDAIQKSAIEYFEHNRPAGPMHIDGLLYTNNAIFGIVHRSDVMSGQLIVNGSLVCADLGILAPGNRNNHVGAQGNVPGSPYAVGLRLNYDQRVRDMLNVRNPLQVTIRRTLWNPTANLL